MNLKLPISVLLLFFMAASYAQELDSAAGEITEKPPTEGNFILSASQQPGPLIGFGQNIIDQNQLQLYLLTDEFRGEDRYNVEVAPSVLYGVTDNFSIYFNMPVAVSVKDPEGEHTSGLEDTSLQFEYAFYQQDTRNYSDQATVVSNVSFPTGSSSVQPNTGVGSPSFFLGGTFNRTYVKWFMFTSYGAVFNTENYNTQFGNQFLYQAGLGRNLFDIEDKWIFAWEIEADGQYAAKNKINGVLDDNSGGNIVYVTPSLWISSKDLIFQFGVGAPVTQHLYGNQGTNHYLLELNLGWTF